MYLIIFLALIYKKTPINFHHKKIKIKCLSFSIFYYSLFLLVLFHKYFILLFFEKMHNIIPPIFLLKKQCGIKVKDFNQVPIINDIYIMHKVHTHNASTPFIGCLAHLV
jgi:hypothetical protein